MTPRAVLSNRKKRPGRGAGGRFMRGCKPGPGRPPGSPNSSTLDARIARRIVCQTATENDLREIVRVLIKQAKAGDLAACREVLDRVCGRATDTINLGLADEQVGGYGQRVTLGDVLLQLASRAGKAGDDA